MKPKPGLGVLGGGYRDARLVGQVRQVSSRSSGVVPEERLSQIQCGVCSVGGPDSLSTGRGTEAASSSLGSLA